MNAVSQALQKPGPIVVPPPVLSTAPEVQKAPPLAPAVATAVNQAQGISQGAQAINAANPIVSQIDRLMADQTAAMAAAKPKIEAYDTQIAETLAEPAPAPVALPKMAAMPAAPTAADVAKERGVDVEDLDNPMRTFGQFMPLLIAFGALATRQPGINALNAATAAMNAVRAGDKEAWAKAQKDWELNTRVVLQENQQLSSEYKLALEDRNATMAERMSRVQTLAAAKKDTLALAMLNQGQIENLFKRQEILDRAAKPIEALMEFNERSAQHAAELQLRERLAKAEILARQNPGFVGQGDVVGTILNKMRLGQTLTPEESAVLDYANSGTDGMGNPNPTIQELLERSKGTGAPPPPAAPPAPAPGLAARAAAAGAPPPRPGGHVPGSVVPPVSALTAGVMNHLRPPGSTKVEIWVLRDGKPKFLGVKE